MNKQMKSFITKQTLYLFLLLTVGISNRVLSATIKVDSPKLTLREFIQRATTQDHNFEAILINQLPLLYQHDLLMPDSDVILDVKYQNNFYLSQDRNNPEAVLSLSKLFPVTGTDVSVSYNKTSSATSIPDDSSLQLLISQPIARNAFGKNTQLLSQITDIKNDVSRYQVVEAYEDYLASLSAIYYSWYSAYENLRVGQASYRSNQRLMKNILERQRQNIALPVDVNKMKLLLLGKKENLVVLEELYSNLSNLIFKSINNNATPYIPAKPERPTADVQFERDYENFTQNSRTYKILRLLEQQGTLQVKKAADDLLPSTNLLLGYKLEGKDWGVKQQQRDFFAGISLRWPIGRTVDKAKYQVSKIEYKKTVLSNQNKYAELQTNLKNIYLQIEREQKLISMSQQKTSLSESILRDESENYSFGKITLNDYITAVNRVDENKFSYTEHQVQLNKLLLEWLRITDRLVNKSILTTD